MKELVFSLNATLPLFICCLIGFLARRKNFVSDTFVEDCSSIVFYIAIPCNIFCSIANSDFQEVFDWTLIIFLFICCLVIAVISLISCKKTIKNPVSAVTVAHNIFRGNFTLLGIPLAVSLLGDEGAAPMMLLVPFGILFSNVFGVFILTSQNKQPATGFVKNIFHALWVVIKNPMTISSILGILVAWLRIPLPTIALNTVSIFSNMSSGLALFMLGAQLKLSNIRKNAKYTAITTLFRLLVIPICVVGAAIALGFRSNALAAIFIFFASPSAVTCYVLAGQMGGDKELAGEAVLATSCFSTLTMMIGIFILRTLQLF